MLHYILLEDRLGLTTRSCTDGIKYNKMPETEEDVRPEIEDCIRLIGIRRKDDNQVYDAYSNWMFLMV